MNETWKAYAAELAGCFGFIFIGAGAVCVNQLTFGGLGLVGVALAHGLAFSILTVSLGGFSGGHFNPALTLAAWMRGDLPPERAGGYLASQIVGAVLGALALRILFDPVAWQAVNLGAPTLGIGMTPGRGVLLEAVLTFFLTLVFLAVTSDESAGRMGGFAVGLTVAMGALVGGPLTGAALNPARAVGPALVSNFWGDQWIYWAGPLLGAAAAGALWRKALRA